MAEPEQRGCATCKWARFEMTKEGEINGRKEGWCEWPVPRVENFPWCISELNAEMAFSKCGILPHVTNCPTWEAKEPK